MIGIVKEEIGGIFNSDNFSVVKKELKAGGVVEKHNHPDHNILFVVVKGAVDVFLEDDEKHELEPGKILNFDGKNHINAKAKEDSEFFVVLIKQ